MSARLAAAHGVQLLFYAVELHNAIEKGERQHEQIHRILSLVQNSHKYLLDERFPRYAIKVINATTNADGLVPTFLMF